MIRHTCRLVLAALLIAAATATATAQQTTGSITGRVLDEQKAAVPGATITVRSASTGFTRSEVSDRVLLEQPAEGGHAGFPTGPFPGRVQWLPARLLHFFDYRR